MTPVRCLGRLNRAVKRVNVTVLDGDAAVIAGVRFIGATLWADGLLSGLHLRPHEMTGEGVRRPDGQGTITHGDERACWTKPQSMSCLSSLSPIMLSLVDRVPPALRAHPGAELFASDLSGLMTRHPIALWVHGHIHAREDRVHGSGTRIVANPAGPLFTTPGFEDDCVVAV